MIGIDPALLRDAALIAIAPRLLWVESIVLGLFLAFSMMSAGKFARDPAALVPRTRRAGLFGMATLLAAWGLFTYSLGIDQTFLALELALALVLSIVHPTMAIGFFIVFLFLRPWEIVDPDMTVVMALPRIYALLAIGCSVLYLYRSKNWSLRLGTPVFLLAGFALWAFLSTFKRTDFTSVQSLYVDGFFKAVILFILVTQCVRDLRDFKMLQSALIFSALGISLVSIYRTVNTPDLYAARIGSFGLLADPNDISAVMILVFPFAYSVLRQASQSKFLRAIALLTLISSGTLLYYAKSRGALLALLITVGAMFVLNFKNKRNAVIVAGLALLLFLPLSAGFKRSASDLDASSESRIIYWETAALMAIHSPFLGVGFSGYPLEFEHYAPKFVESGIRTAHSSWFLALAETGFPGLFLFASLYGWALSASWGLRHRFPEVFFSTLGYGVAMSFLSHTYAVYFYILLGTVFVASRLPDVQGQTEIFRRPRFGRRAVALFFGAFLFSHLSQGTAAWAADASGISLELAPGSDKPIGRFAPVTSSRLELKGSRGEVLSFQLKLRVPTVGTGCVKLGFEGPTELRARFYEMSYVQTHEPSFPGAYVGSHHDPLVPLSDGVVCPDPKTPTWVWGEVKIDPGTRPQDYSAFVTAKSVKGSEPLALKLPVQLRVWKMIIPEHPAIPLYAEYSSWYGVLGHYGKTNPGEGVLSQKYADEMQAHRIQAMKSWVKIPRVSANGLLDLDESPEGHSSFREVVLDHHLSWSLFDFPKPFDVPTAEQGRYWKAVEKTLVQAQAQGHAFVYLWDEPKVGDYRELTALARAVKEQAPDLKLLVTTSAYEKMPRSPELEKAIDILVPIMGDWEGDFANAKMDRYRQLQRQGKQLWTYLSCVSHGCGGAVESGYPDWVLDRPSVWIRSMTWILSRMKIDGFLYYDVDYAYQFYPKKDPWTDLWYFTGNGDGTLFYPGRPGQRGLKEHQPIDSIRIKVWREASFDAEYIKWMGALPSPPSWWMARYSALVESPTSWSKNYADYQALRDQAGEYLNGL